MIGNEIISLLMYADDIALIAPNEHNLQEQLDVINCWCNEWKLKINASKTQIVHFRQHTKKTHSISF